MNHSGTMPAPVADMDPPETAEEGVGILSFGQQRLWLLDRLAPGTALYNIPHLVRLAGPLDAAALGRALESIVQRHESLRTAIVTCGNEARQHCIDAGSFVLEQTDLGAV